MTALLTVILSFLGALVCGLMPASAHQRIRWVALATAAAGFVVSMVCYFNLTGGEIADKKNFDWIPTLGISFITGYDGISLPRGRLIPSYPVMKEMPNVGIQSKFFLSAISPPVRLK